MEALARVTQKVTSRSGKKTLIPSLMCYPTDTSNQASQTKLPLIYYAEARFSKALSIDLLIPQ